MQRPTILAGNGRGQAYDRHRTNALLCGYHCSEVGDHSTVVTLVNPALDGI